MSGCMSKEVGRDEQGGGSEACVIDLLILLRGKSELTRRDASSEWLRAAFFVV